jgi:hypothetical protein
MHISDSGLLGEHGNGLHNTEMAPFATYAYEIWSVTGNGEVTPKARQSTHFTKIYVPVA